MTDVNLAFAVLQRVEDTLTGARRALRRRAGVTKPPRILPMKGFGARDGVRMRARVLEDRSADDASRQGNDQRLSRWRLAFRRWSTLEIPRARIEIQWRDKRWQAITSEEGYIDIVVPAPSGAPSGWNDVSLRIVDDGYRETVCAARVFVVGDPHDFGIISDIDDTVINTGAASVLSLATSFVYELPSEKKPFPGIDELYRALHAGSDRKGRNPVFYVSSSPFNLYEHLETLFDNEDMPEGPLLLRDWGFDFRGLTPDGSHEHKVEKVRDILKQTGDLRFVLLGDTGQQDPELYRRIVEEYPRRIAMVAVRDVSGPRRDAKVSALGEAIEAQGVPFVAVETTASIARALAERGFIPEVAAAEVAAAAAAESR